MKKIVLFMSLLMTSGLLNIAYATKPAADALDQIIAVVNDDVITKSELTHALSLAKVQMAEQNITEPPAAIFQKQVLDQLITKKLELQIAKQAGINITDGDLDRAIDTVASRNNITSDQLYERLTSEGMTKEDYREELRDQLTMQKLQQQDIASRITISPDEVNHFMHSQTWQKNDSKEYHLQDILISLSDTPSTEEIAAAKKHALEVMAKLHQGKNFNQVAASESNDKHALQGGDLGWRKLSEIPSAFTNVVAGMHANEIQGPIQTPNGFHIIRLAEERSVSDKQPLPDRKQIEDQLLQRKFEEALQSWVSKLKSQAFIETPQISSALS